MTLARRAAISASLDAPLPPISPSPVIPSSVSTSTSVRTSRPGWTPCAYLSGCCSGIATVVDRTSVIFTRFSSADHTLDMRKSTIQNCFLQ
jgi:hypothetical protein